MLALPAPGCEDDKVTLVTCGISLRRKRVEPAGHSFHDHHEKPGLEGKRRGRDAAKKDQAGSDDEAEAPNDSWRKKKKEAGKSSGTLKLSPLLVGEDLYNLLEVSQTASAEQIKKQYRKMALQHHPDKQGTGEEKPSKGLNEQDKHFIKIQEAYEILSDMAKRRQYDSTLDFDDSFPEEVNEKIGFFETFAPVFRRNARWSNRFPVPELGDDKTDLAKVHKFYDFWFNFDSWRDFSTHDEYDLNDAEFREERRWMERQNQRIRKKYVQDENRRIIRLAETAERLDPRIRAEREEREAKKREEKEKRARAKQEELEAKQREEEEKRRKAEQEKAAQAEKERLEREQRKADKQVAKGLRQRFKKAVQAQCKLGALEMEELQEFCLALESEQLEDLCKRLEAEPKGAKSDALVRQELAEAKKRRAAEEEEQARQRQEAKKLEEQKAQEAKESAANASAWSTEELGVLAKGLQKFPGGMGGRWGLITKMLNECGFQRTEKEVLDKTKELSGNMGTNMRSMGSKIPQSDTLQAGAKAAPKAKAQAAAEPTAQKQGEKDAEGKAEEAKADEWSAEQQQALEKALQRHPATLDKNERWKLIAEDVPGKTKSQCVARFKYLREQVSKAKS
eukprot:TRINITY_DN76267_c0_g1_i1.p1 TRINITY_DN76267_c0_g1~~TRINITY_DN76267_c0_g1_i1.p1  ORF type:complete len:622 (+),score=230.19 TRINITY_DN76267_c0_g1_i1:85-1950(+)